MENIKKIILLFSGIILLSIGIILMVKASIGADPLTTFFLALSKTLHLSYGRASQIFMVILLGIVFIFDKKRIGFGTFVHALGVGFLFDLFMPYANFVVNSTFLNYAMFILGDIFMGLGIALYINAKLGEGAVDAVMILFVNKFNLNIKYVKITIDAILVITGITLGQSIGIGTVIALAFTGPFIGIFMNLIKKLEKKEKNKEALTC